jgi:hypothetical protein
LGRLDADGVLIVSEKTLGVEPSLLWALSAFSSLRDTLGAVFFFQLSANPGYLVLTSEKDEYAPRG